MRRALLVASLVALVVFPAPAVAATPPDPTLAVSSVHYAGRGVIELDVTFTCVAPPARGYDWEPYLYVGVEQGRGRSWRSGGAYMDLDRDLCDGTTQTTVVQVATEEGRAFKGRRAVIWGELEASWERRSTGAYTDQWASFDAYVRVARR